VSLKASQIVWRFSAAAGMARLLLLAIADMADNEGVSEAKIKTLAKACNASERAVQKWREELVALGELRFTKRPLEGSRNQSNLYQIVLGEWVHPVGEPSFTHPPNKDPIGCTTVHPVGEPSFTQVGEQVFTHKQLKEQHIKTTLTTAAENFSKKTETPKTKTPAEKLLELLPSAPLDQRSAWATRFSLEQLEAAWATAQKQTKYPAKLYLRYILDGERPITAPVKHPAQALVVGERIRSPYTGRPTAVEYISPDGRWVRFEEDGGFDMTMEKAVKLRVIYPTPKGGGF
jgi:hypothetical protein